LSAGGTAFRLGVYDSAFYMGHTADNGSWLYGRDKSYISLDSISLIEKRADKKPAAVFTGLAVTLRIL
jgi:hypothetical protein